METIQDQIRGRRRAQGVYRWPDWAANDAKLQVAMLDWSERHNVRRSNARCMHWLRQGTCLAGCDWNNLKPAAWLRHAHAWHRLPPPLLLVSQPVDPLSEADQSALDAIAAESIFRVKILRPGWLEPDHLSVEIWRLDGGGIRPSNRHRFPPDPIDVSDILFD